MTCVRPMASIAAVSATAAPYSELKSRFVSNSYYLDLEGGTQRTLRVFSSMKEDDGTFLATLQRTSTYAVQSKRQIHAGS